MTTTPSDSIVIVGGGHAGAQLCAALAEAGHGSRVHLVCEEPELPYQRPPLSKSFLKKPAEALLLHRAEAGYAEAGITLHRGDPAVAIDRARRVVRLRSGAEPGYGQLVLATGTRARRLPHLGEPLSNVAVLRSAADALALSERLHHVPPGRLTVLGGGFIGLEIAATARLLGVEVEVLESAPRLLARSVSPELAEHVQASHRAAGVQLHLGVRVGEFEFEEDEPTDSGPSARRLAALQVDGERRPVDWLVLGIGAVPETELARAAGIEVDNGVVVDDRLRSVSDPAILAIGDCASFPEATSGRRLRLESVQNANDQARFAAAVLLGGADSLPTYRALPWFWSEQGALRLQMAGLMPHDGGGVRHRRPGAHAGSFSLLHYVGDAGPAAAAGPDGEVEATAQRLVCVESVNSPLDHLMARKLLEAGRSPPPEVACDPAVALKALV